MAGPADPCFRLDFREGAAALGSRAPGRAAERVWNRLSGVGDRERPCQPSPPVLRSWRLPRSLHVSARRLCAPPLPEPAGLSPRSRLPNLFARRGTGRDGAARGAGSRQALPAARPATSHQPPARGEEQQGAPSPSPSRGHVASSACGMRAAPGRPPERLAGHAWSALSPAAQTVPPGAAATPSPPAPTRPSPESESESAACGPAPGGPCEPTCGSGSCPCARTPT